MTDRELMQQALEALEEVREWNVEQAAARTALRERLAQSEQEPVAGQPLPCPFCGANDGLTMTDGSTYRWGYAYCSNCGASAGETRRAYPDDGEWYKDAIQQWNQRATPPRREWVGLTQQDIDIAFDDTQEGGGFDDFARAIEAKLKEKNT